MEAEVMTTHSAASTWIEVADDYQLNSLYPIDPYHVWAVITEWQGFGDGDSDGIPENVRVLMELPDKPDTGSPGWEGVAAIIRSNPLNYLDSKTGEYSRYVTANVPITELPKLTDAVRNGLLARFQLGLARGGVPDDNGKEEIPQGTMASRRATAPPLAAIAAAAVAETDHALQDAPGMHSDSLRTIGVIDDGCCLAHEGFRRAGRTDFLLVWDQNTRDLQLPWTRYAGISYGQELWNSTIDELLEQFPERGEPEERRFYAEKLHRPRWGDADRTHGAGVLHIAWNSWNPEPWGKFFLLFVQLPTDTVADTSGGSLGVYIMDGARYIVRRTRHVAEMIEKKDFQCTINISLGSIAGPHDGTTITELALAELGADPRVRIVLAAGNTAGKQVHAFRAISKERPGRFDFAVPPDNERESYVEVWLPIDDSVQADDFDIEVLAPNGARLEAMGVGRAARLPVEGRTVASLVFARWVAQGQRGTMALLAIRSTALLDGRGGGAPYGTWSFVVSSRLAREVGVHAWVERNDILIGGRMPQQTRFVDDDSHYVDDRYTLSSIANGSNVTVVGAFRQQQMVVSDYSANGPTVNHARRRVPDIYGPADRSDALPGQMLPGFWSGTSTRMSGTSSAAPHVARWMARGSPTDQRCDIHTLDGKSVVEGILPQRPFYGDA